MEVILKAIDNGTNHLFFQVENSEQQQEHSVTFEQGDFEILCNSIRETLGATDQVPLFYFDEDGDKIFIGSKEELEECFCHLSPRSSGPSEAEKKKAQAQAVRIEKVRQAKKEKLMKSEEALEGRLEVLQKRIEEFEEKKEQVKKLKEAVAKELDFLEHADQEELEVAFAQQANNNNNNNNNNARKQKQQKQQQQQKQKQKQQQRQIVQLEKQKTKIQQQLNALADKSAPKAEEKKKALAQRLNGVMDRQARLKEVVGGNEGEALE